MSASFPDLLHSFFHEWLGSRDLSRHTVLSYRDTWRLFLRFAAARKGKPAADLSLPDLGAAEVLAFLQQREDEAGATTGTRNCRLAALRSFYHFLQSREPSAAEHCDAVLRIPMRRVPKPPVFYLGSDEIAAVLNEPDRATPEGFRDHVLLALLYNTGARIQEVLNVCPKAIRLTAPAQVRLSGSRGRERVCPIWPETAELLQELLRRQPRGSNDRIFVNRYGQPLGAAGVRFKLSQYVRAAAQKAPSLAAKQVSPQTFRHSAAVHLIAAGVDVKVIRSWLGHSRLDSANRYAQTGRQFQALCAAAAARPEPLSWLDSLAPRFSAGTAAHPGQAAKAGNPPKEAA